MDKKQLIERIRNFNKNKAKLQNINSKIEYMKNDYIGCGSRNFDNMGIKSGRVYSSSVENEILAKEKELELLEIERKKLALEVEVLERAFDVVSADNINKTLIEEYLLYKQHTLEELSIKLYINKQTLTRKYGKLLETINWLIE